MKNIFSEREAGFYTTRFGRSDPMMRFHEVQTRFVPEPQIIGALHHPKVDIGIF